MTPPEDLFDELVAVFLRRPGVDLGPMLHTSGLRVHGKVFAFLGRGGRLMVKLPAVRVDELQAGGAGERVVMGKRAMREWVSVPPSPDEPGLWAALAEESFAFAGAGAS
jgi:hypothetical protein